MTISNTVGGSEIKRIGVIRVPSQGELMGGG